MLTENQINVICKEIQTYPYVKAILVTGSYIYGSPNETSDLDIRMIVDDKKFEKAHWDDLWRFNVRIEAFYNTVESIELYMDQAKKGVVLPKIIHFWANGKIIYDPEGFAKKLQESAKNIWRQGNYKYSPIIK
ncbi:MAG: nucleotidyltransferase domain-containing protein [Candidatus Roizmanbacteria bacterium]|nr:nucleotidyltransferase domain-containing protein [Candidatus Roizmanbacteria bacterium]